jgi:chitinase
MLSSLRLLFSVSLACFLTKLTLAYDFSRNDNLAVYWGQDSAGDQQPLRDYCEDDTIDIIPLAFLYIFQGEGGVPVVDFGNVSLLFSINAVC